MEAWLEWVEERMGGEGSKDSDLINTFKKFCCEGEQRYQALADGKCKIIEDKKYYFTTYYDFY